MSLIIKRLSKLTEGTRVELTYGGGDDHQRLVGTIGENDGEAEVELLCDNGDELIIRYAAVQGVKVLEAMPANVPAPTPVNVPAPTPVNVPAPKPANAPAPKPTLVSEPKPAPGPVSKPTITTRRRVPLYQQNLSSNLSTSDNDLKNMLKALPREERQWLSGIFDSYCFGIKNNDKGKKLSAASTVKQTYLSHYDEGYNWSPEASRFCGLLCRRECLYEPEIFERGDWFWEAAWTSHAKNDEKMTGVYAALALMEGNQEHRDDLLILLATAVVRTNDASYFRVMYEYKPDLITVDCTQLIADLFEYRGVTMNQTTDAESCLKILESLYAADEGAKILQEFFPEEAEPEEPVIVEKAMEELYGVISKLFWANQTGEITGDDGSVYTFRYEDVKDSKLTKKLKDCLSTDMGGKIYPVHFNAVGKAARNIYTDNAVVARARSIALNPNIENRFRMAFNICKIALKTHDVENAIYELIKNTLAIYKAEQDEAILEEAIGHYEAHAAHYPAAPFPVLDVAQCYFMLKNYDKAIELADYALSSSSLEPKQRSVILHKAMQYCEAAWTATQEKRLIKKLLERSDEWIAIYEDKLQNEPGNRSVYQSGILPQRIESECHLERLSAAEADLAKLSYGSEHRPRLLAMVEELRRKLAPQEAQADEGQDTEYDEEYDPEYAEESEDLYEDEELAAPLSIQDIYSVSGDESEEELISATYEDKEGWEALKMTKEDVIDYALAIRGDGRLAPILAYLNAGGQLCKDIQPTYHMVALAVNDPMAEPDYSLTALHDAISQCDPGYPVLNDCCMASAFMRSSFLGGRGYDYGAQGLRRSIALGGTLPALDTVYDILEEFRQEVGHGIDIYAEYRRHDMRMLEEEMDKLRRDADDLYTKFVVNVPRESASFERFLDTKRFIFNKEGYFATMLRYVVEENREALLAAKEEFAERHLSGSGSVARMSFVLPVIDEIIDEAWVEAGKLQTLKKSNKTLQGDRRNNLRSNIKDVLRAIVRWYELSEQYDGYNWRTQKGEEAYSDLGPRLQTALAELIAQCTDEMKQAEDPQYITGLFLLKKTAEELDARLDGSWSNEQRKFIYADFVHSDAILLNEEFMPNLSATLCALPEFNILARIRRHVEQPKMGIREHLEKIYGEELTHHNYGQARRIVEFAAFQCCSDLAEIPVNAERFEEQAQVQADMFYRIFLENFALSQNYGRIMQSDSFCYGLDETIRYWYRVCRTTGNYGFFHELLIHAEDKIRSTAHQYELQLEEQLEALVASNREKFTEHPEYEEAIRNQIAQQNFIVAEDFMRRVRTDKFSLEVEMPEALKHLKNFTDGYRSTFTVVSNLNNSLGTVYPRVDKNPTRETKQGQKLLETWIHHPLASAARIETLIGLLGWKNIAVNQDKLPSDPKLELYKVTKTIQSGGRESYLHPIAAFGSRLEVAGMHVACLYGLTGEERLFATIKALDTLKGNKILFLDCALGLASRRNLAMMLKKREVILQNTYMIVDRMVISYLASHYSESTVNAMLMAITMPFSYCQPYVADSAHTLPPEMFIGRKDELLRIEDPAGVNLIYGGRQLGKTALFKKARLDLDGYQGNRAVLVDLYHCDCASAARRVSRELIDLNILVEGQETEDWGELCHSIKSRLRKEEDLIPYFLLMLDEADTFIEDCGKHDYLPLVELKDVQQSLPERFKFVLGGLHNVVRFNRDVALGRNAVITHLPSLKITPFRTAEAQELLTGPLSYLGFSIQSEVTISQILATVNYFPGLIQLYCQKLIESVRESDYAGYTDSGAPPYVVSAEHIRRVMSDREFVAQIVEKYEITLRLDEDQGSCYYPLALLISLMYHIEPSKVGYTPEEVLNMAKDLMVYPLAELDVEKIEALMLELLDLNILRNVDGNTYLLASKNFRDLLGNHDEIAEKLTKFGGKKE